MPQLTTLYWRDIPTQVIAKQGRTAAKRELSKRFIEAVDMAAMRSGAAATDDYLADWRKGDPVECGADLEAEAAAEAERLEARYDKAALKALIDNQGRA